MQDAQVIVSTVIYPFVSQKEAEAPIVLNALPTLAGLAEMSKGWKGFHIEQRLTAQTDPQDGPVSNLASTVFATTKLMLIGATPATPDEITFLATLGLMSPGVAAWYVPRSQFILLPETARVQALPEDSSEWSDQIFEGLVTYTRLTEAVKLTPRTNVIYGTYHTDRPGCGGHQQQAVVEHRTLEGLHFPAGTRDVRFVDYFTAEATLPSGLILPLQGEARNVSPAHYVGGVRMTARDYAKKFGMEQYAMTWRALSNPECDIVLWEKTGRCAEFKDGDMIVPFQE